MYDRYSNSKSTAPITDLDKRNQWVLSSYLNSTGIYKRGWTTCRKMHYKIDVLAVFSQIQYSLDYNCLKYHIY
jgi:hypothetical protein